MNFSDSFQATRHLVSFSPDGNLLASSSQHRVVIRDARSFQILHLHTCLDPVQHIQWSPDSSLLLCGLYKRGLVQVWSVKQPEWTCKIDEGSAGLVGCYWSPDSRHIITVADFRLRLTLWSLINKSVSYIKYPKLVQGGLEFSPNGQHMALAERRDCKDYLSIFDTEKWNLVRHFSVDTKDLAGLSWSPNGNIICVWESCFTYHLYLYTIDGYCISSYTAYSELYQFGLGIKSVTWSPSGQFLAVGSYDQKVRLLNHITWKVIAEYDHVTIVDDSSVAIYNEVEQSIGNIDPNVFSTLTKTVFPMQSKYETQDVPFTVPSIKPDPSKANPKLGVKNILFSSSNRYMATLNENMSTAVWIWDVTKISLVSILTHTSSVRDIQWDPMTDRLAICTNTGRLYLWSIDGCISVVVPSDPPLNVQKLQWHPTGRGVILIGSTHFCVCLMNVNNE